MTDYISRQAAIEALAGWNISEIVLAPVPAADVRENVKENWIKRVDYLDYGLIEFEGVECPACGFRIWKNDYENIEFKFCPCCGADMRGNNHD